MVVVFFGSVPEVGALLHASVVDENVSRTEGFPGLIDEVADGIDLGDIGLHDDAFGPGGGDLLQGLLGAFRVAAIVDDDIRAFGGEADCDALPNAGARSGDDGRAALQGRHANLLFYVCKVDKL